MVRFRRNYVPGGTYFFTVTLRDRQSRALTDHIGLLREAFRDVRKAHPFQILAIVVLPEHLYTVIMPPEGNADYSGRWKAIKGQFSRSLVTAGVRLEKDKRASTSGSRTVRRPRGRPGFRFASSRLRATGYGLGPRR
jgi:putative transposase